MQESGHDAELTGRMMFALPNQEERQPMTKDEINTRIEACEAKLASVRADLVNGPQSDPPVHIVQRRDELTKEIAELKAMLDEE